MRLFWKRKAKSAAPLTAIADLPAAQWSGMGQLAREGFEKNAVAYRCVRMIAEAPGSVGFRAVDDGKALARLLARAVDVHNAGGAWANALIDNAARPSGALVYTGGLELMDEQWAELREELDRTRTGRRMRSGRCCRRVVRLRPMSLSPAEMDFVEQRNVAAR